jgi:hypothetical protein
MASRYRIIASALSLVVVIVGVSCGGLAAASDPEENPQLD